jgi:Ca2+-binding RTX toxin-like protein
MVAPMDVRAGRRLRLGLVLAGSFLGLVPVAAVGVGTLDQQQLNAPHISAFHGPDVGGDGSSVGQTFTPQLTGALDQVDLHLKHEPGAVNNTVGVTVEIRNVVPHPVPFLGFIPASTAPLASTTVPAAAIAAFNTGGAFVAATFATPASVTAGTQYAIVAYTVGSEIYHWYRSDNDNPYPGGTFVGSATSPPSSWFPEADKDFAFKAYVTTPPTTAQCNGLDATITGTEGDDELVGTKGVDVIVSLGGNDTISGLGSADHICGGSGNDAIRGGNGYDILFGNEGDDTLHGELGRDRIRGESGADTIHGGENHDKLFGGIENDTINGEAGDDTIRGDGGNDALNGGTGDDNISGGRGNDTIDGGDGTGDVCDDGPGTGPPTTGCP